MTAKRSWRTFLGGFLVSAAAIGFFPSISEATHFRYGHYTWTPTTGTSVEFRIQNAFRRDGYFCISPSTLNTVPCTSADGFPSVGDVFYEFIGATRLNFGDGSPLLGSPRGPLMYIVTSVDVANDWIFALALDPASLPAIDTTISHTYPAPGGYVAFTDSCCRISAIDEGNAHLNNPDGGYRVQTFVTIGDGNSSPVSALPPVIICPFPATCTFLVPGADPNGDSLRFRLSSPAEASSGSLFRQPGTPGSRAPNPATVSGSGLYTWDTTGATLGPAGTTTLYSTQVTIEDLDASGNAKSSVALDFLLQLVPCPAAGCTPPVFPPPPVGVPPVCNATLPATVGGVLTFAVGASDANAGDLVMLNVVALPAGAVMSPPLPTSGNPVSSTFAWVPTPADVGTIVITFTATSPDGTALCPVTVEVSANTPPTAACTPGPNPGGHVPNATNEDGFFRLTSTDAQDGAGMLFVRNQSGNAVFGPFPPDTVLKITEAPGAPPSIRPIGGPNSSVTAHVTLDSDALVYAIDSGGLSSPVAECRVPPPPK